MEATHALGVQKNIKKNTQTRPAWKKQYRTAIKRFQKAFAALEADLGQQDLRIAKLTFDQVRAPSKSCDPKVAEAANALVAQRELAANLQKDGIDYLEIRKEMLSILAPTQT